VPSPSRADERRTLCEAGGWRQSLKLAHPSATEQTDTELVDLTGSHKRNQTMDNSKIDLKKKDKRAEGLPTDVKAELSEEELSKASGGNLASACAKGVHLKEAKIT
jgi:hypothetical protein